MTIKLDSILLFTLIIPFIMTVSLSPDKTPYWLFGIIFLGLFIYLLLDIIKISEKQYFKYKHILLWSLIILVIGSAFASAMIVRRQAHPTYQIHDMPLQQEIAMRFLLDGKNPYATTYFGTFLEQWHYSEKEVNPALYHFVLPPLYILFALPFYFLSIPIFGFFDARMPLLFLFLALLMGVAKLVKDERQRLLFLILLAFNPATLLYMLEGRSDFFMFSFLFFAFLFLHKKRYLLAGIPMAMAFAVKQSVWPIFPLYIAFLYFKNRNIAWTIKQLGLSIIVLSAIFVPFLLWDTKALLDSTVFYLSGNAPNSYPVSGYGFGMILVSLGIIKDIHNYYPFLIWQIGIGAPVLVWLLIYLRKIPTVSRLILFYGVFLFVFWYFSRYLNNSHLGYLSTVFITAYFWPKDEE